MIHGPCGLAKKIAPCMRNGSCSVVWQFNYHDSLTTSITETKDALHLWQFNYPDCYGFPCYTSNYTST